jgi:hypothetical protein
LALLDIAKQDAKEIKHWYSSIRKELGKRFTADLKIRFFLLNDYPQHMP